MHSTRANHRNAFTLIELLVVIGIIGLLAGILLPAIVRTMRQGARTRMKADLNTIAIALEAYKADFGDYPRPPIDPTTGQPVRDTGAATLGKALIGPYGDGKLSDGTTVDPNDPPSTVTGDLLPGKVVFDGTKCWVAARQTTVATPAIPDWAVFDPHDGLDGPGARARVGGGRTYGPYLKAENFKMVGMDLCDRDGNPILYFPATPGHPNVSAPYGFVAVMDRGLAPPRVPLYNAADNVTIFRRSAESTDDNAITRIQCVCGDYDGSYGDGSIKSPWGKDTDFTGSSGFLLWSAGPDGLFGPTSVWTVGSPTNWQNNFRETEKCDDVTNFR